MDVIMDDRDSWMNPNATWRVRVDDDGPALWLYEPGSSQPTEAFQPAWDHPAATWHDVLRLWID